MPSPFPGMNPYLEHPDEWQDFHDRFIVALSDALSMLVRPHFIVKVEHYHFIHEPPAEARFPFAYGDIGVSEPKNARATLPVTGTLISPVVTAMVDVEFEKHRFIEIRDRKNREVVTVLEMLSPTNKKPGADREQYLAKRSILLRSEANFVEIDLLRGWKKMPIADPQESDYAIMVSRVDDRPRLNYWPINVRDPLPSLPVPLRSPTGHVEVNLKAILDGVYDRAGYADYIYLDVPKPPLHPEDAAWAEALVAQAVNGKE